VALIVVMVCAAAVCMRSVLLTANGVRWGDAEPQADELLGAADYNTISGKATIFWGEEDGMPGRYPPAYAAQLKKMRRLVQQVKLNNERSKMMLKEEDTQIREIKREMEMTAEATGERLMTNVDNFKPEIAQLSTRAGPLGPAGPQGFSGKDGFNGWGGVNGHPGQLGRSGKPGVMGPPGPPGRNGMQGPMGPEGNTGPQGPRGPVGQEGPNIIACAGGLSPSTNTRLIDCNSLGCRVEISHQGKWGTVCGNDFTNADARVTCRAMGFNGGKAQYKFGHDFYRESVGPMPIWVKKAQCLGDEVKLQHCKGVHALGEAAWPAKACENHDTDVGVCCVHATAH